MLGRKQFDIVMRTIISCFIICFLGACGDFGHEPLPDLRPPIFTATFESIQIEDSELLRVAYSEFKMPQAFYQEDLHGGFPYYETNLSITPLSLRQPPFFELSTNDEAQAFAWSESSDVHSSYHRPIVSERQTEKYFEFQRVNPQNHSDILLSRVHKLSYIDRSMFDFSNPTPLVGRLNARPIDTLAATEFAQYFWFLSNCAMFGAKALAAIPKDDSDTAYCALYHVSRVQGDFGVRDMISLHRTVYAISKINGDIFQRTGVIRYVEGTQH